MALVNALVVALAAQLAQLAAGLGSMEVMYKWRAVDYEFPSKAVREDMIRNDKFIPGNPVPIDVDVYQTENEQKIFMTLPRFKDGVPASLVTISEHKDGESHLLKPYPDWSWHSEHNCDGVTSAFRMQIDKCGRLWVIDSGMVDLFKYPRRRLCQPQLLAFSLVNDRLSGRHRFPSSILQEGSVLTTVAVDVRDAHNQCTDTFAYVADVTSYQLLVFDARRDVSWRIQSNTMYPSPPFGVFKTNNVEFDLMDGIIGLALGPVVNGDRTLYFNAFATVSEAAVQTSIIRNESLFNTGFNTAPRAFKLSAEVKASQSAPKTIDKNGNIYFAPVARNSVFCWNTQQQLSAHKMNELVKDDVNLQFMTGIKVVELGNGDEELWGLTDRFHLVMVGKMDSKEVNFRIVKGRISDLTRATSCRPVRPISFPKPNRNQRPYQRPNGYGVFSG